MQPRHRYHRWHLLSACWKAQSLRGKLVIDAPWNPLGRRMSRCKCFETLRNSFRNLPVTDRCVPTLGPLWWFHVFSQGQVRQFCFQSEWSAYSCNFLAQASKQFRKNDDLGRCTTQPALLLSSLSEIICHSEQLGAFLPWESDTRSSSRQIAMLNVEVGFE